MKYLKKININLPIEIVDNIMDYLWLCNGCYNKYLKIQKNWIYTKKTVCIECHEKYMYKQFVLYTPK
mgnify:CR=1 FL=1|jgi:hypothetical protein